VDLANPAKIEQYNGIKHADDTHDAFFLAELQRLKILPTAQVYDSRAAPVRDLLRRRTTWCVSARRSFSRSRVCISGPRDRTCPRDLKAMNRGKPASSTSIRLIN